LAGTQEIEKHIQELGSEDIHEREQARYLLIDAGNEATPLLLEVLKTGGERKRWEAAKLLGEIRDPAAAEALVEALVDQSIGVHWAASEALIAIGQAAIIPLLNGLIHHFDSARFRQGAYHVLHTFEHFQQLDLRALEVLDALRSVEPSASAPWAAERAIEAYMFRHKK
jgi:HEAT repeat protein